MSNDKNLKRLDEVAIYNKKEIQSINYMQLRKEMVETGPRNVIQLVAYFKQFDHSADIDSVEKQLSLWPLFFRKLDDHTWEGIPVEYNSDRSNRSGFIPAERSVKRSNKREYKPKSQPKPANDQRVYKDKNESHFLVIESDTYKRIGPYLKVEAQSVTSTEKKVLTDLSGKEDLLKVFLKNNEKYIFLGHRSILNHHESPDGKALTLKFTPASDDLSMYQLENKSTALIEQSDELQFAVALPFEAPVPLPIQIKEKIEADYRPTGTNFQLFNDRYKNQLLKLNTKEISADQFLNWLAEEKSNVSQEDYEKILRNLIHKKEFKNHLQLLEIAIQCVNDDSSVDFCNDFLDLIIKNTNPESDFKYNAICFADVMLLYPEKLEKKHYRKIAKAYAQNGEYNNAIRYYAETYKDGIKSSDIDLEFRKSLENCEYSEVKESIEALFSANLLKSFEDKINKSDQDEIFDLIISFYNFYKEKVKPDQEDLESFASSVLSVCSINNEWENFDLFYDDIEAREKFMKKPEKKFDMLSIGESSDLKQFISNLAAKYLVVIKKNYDLVTETLKKELVQQVKIFESLTGNPDASLSSWLKNTIKETKINEASVKTEDILKGLKNIFIIGGRDETRKSIERKLIECGAQNVHGEPPMLVKSIDKKTLRGKLSAYDCVVFLTNYMGHMEYYMGKDIANEAGIKMIHCHGGISRLLVELGKLKR